MRLVPGVSLGPYEIVAPIGAGGMGEVYRARDPRLGREVAVKILPAAYSADPDRLRRFEQEARAAAALNHPNILAVFDIGRQDASPYIVSELLEGETLRKRLQSVAPRPMPFPTVVDYARQIARGLASAHDKGIVHRDLKPENLFVTHDGRVKILDFGLAKLTRDIVPPTATAATTPVAAATESGVVLGTAGYMSPEQVRGQQVDHRADIFALGAILFEMLSGRRAFPGDSAADTMMAIMSGTPTLSSAGAAIPPALVRIVDRCLEKDPAARFQSTRDLCFALEGIAPTHAGEMLSPAAGGPVKRGRLPWVVAGGIAALGLAALALKIWPVAPAQVPASAGRVVRFAIQPPGSVALAANASFFALSPTGDRLAIVVTNMSGTPLLWVRSLDSLDATPLKGTDGARQPFWSPDGRFIAFWVPGGFIKKVPAAGGAPETITDKATVTLTGGSWSKDDVIVYSSMVGPIRRISAAGGGEPVPVTKLQGSISNETQAFPAFLPDGKRFLYYSRRSDPADSGIFVKSVSADDARLLVRATSNPTYVSPGYLLYARNGSLVAQPFDADRAQTTADPFPVVERVDQFAETGLAAFSASDTGVLVYSNSPSNARSRLLWFDRGGHQLMQLGQVRSYRNPRLSPDGRRVAVEIVDDTGNRDIWLLDTARGAPVRFTFDPGRDAAAVWSPDGQRIAWLGSDGGYIKSSSGAGTPERWRAGPSIPDDWTRDGGALLYHSTDLQQVRLRPMHWTAAGALETDHAGERQVIRGSTYTSQARVSPDGRWVAFVNFDSGRHEIYVQNFPVPAGRWQVSASGGLQPKWRADGKELFYLALDGRLMAVPVTLGSLVEIGEPQPLFQTRIETTTALTWHQYDVTPDGQRFLVNVPEIVTSPATVVLNWPAVRR